MDAPEKRAIEILAFASLVYLLDLLVCHTRQCLRCIANHRGHVARVTFKSSIIGENKQHLKRDPQELLVDMNNLKHSLNIPPVLFRTEQCANQQSLVVHKPEGQNDLINARGVYSKRGRLIDRRRLKERGVYSHNCNKLNKTNMLSERRQFINQKALLRPSINNVYFLMEIGVHITCTGHKWFCDDYI